MKDLRNLKYFLGIEVLRSKRGIFICQRKYVADLLAETGLIDCKPADTPIVVNHNLRMEINGELADKESICGWISKSVHAPPQVAHMEAAQRILRYLKGTVGHGVLFKTNGHLNVELYTDADWAKIRKIEGQPQGTSPWSMETLLPGEVRTKGGCSVKCRSGV
ncbi:uncharacterized mitochondrial protein AtMg00810-like [Helianthus annuus]|uniref:uncharacterized mitochondrial protein AtMg00810-like n=1 Tax=Helianthus annuus TaxID=4232 RepID=UPI000B8FEFD9|nr:uncharacterized mitochondrial protein AtMg00810-like [Helianthus annuus]